MHDNIYNNYVYTIMWAKPLDGILDICYKFLYGYELAYKFGIAITDTDNKH